MKRGFFGGRFDPIHNGHLHLALELFEHHGLDEIFFCPTSQSPHKKEAPPIASKEARRAMVSAAIAPFPQFTLIDNELQSQDPCYTIDTLRQLIEPKVRYFLLLGEDAALSLPTWQEAEELIKLAPPLVGSRTSSTFSPDKKLPLLFAKAIHKGWTAIPRLEMSSSWIRKRVGEGKNASYLVPGKVWDQIQAGSLYHS